MSHLQAFMVAMLFLGASLVVGQKAYADDQTMVGPMSGVYTSGTKYCDVVDQYGTGAFGIADVIILSLEHGIMSAPWSCEFARIDFLQDGKAAVVTALCDERGFTYADLLSIKVYDDNQIELRSTYQSLGVTAWDEDGGRILFNRCDQIKELKID